MFRVYAVRHGNERDTDFLITVYLKAKVWITLCEFFVCLGNMSKRDKETE